MEIQKENMQHFGFLGMKDPFLLKNMGEALRRIIRAVNEREKIVIYGTCDLDGITSVSLLLLVLKYLNADVEYFISDEIDNFDMNSDIIENYIKFLGTKLIITTGCGINSISQMELCENLGIDVIVTDYHRGEEILPKTIIVDPNLRQCTYPYKDLTAVGVTFKLCQAISMYYEMKCIGNYLDLVALGIISKGVDISGENRIMVNQGMYCINYTDNYGLKALLKINGISNVNRESIYELSNRMTCSIKNKRYIDNASIIVELFTTESMDRAEQIAKYLKYEIV
ncbi:DHH family phosphoesterase [uncultured Clostridium sp.]|uniref:DHH family phosphoesterase n=1 Tax=uncultured Clostridium sp. TaxID=59620 RepID=UPI0025CE63FA|nr:DHH family phosphoesterase [uncultured Clostridium sp.]